MEQRGFEVKRHYLLDTAWLATFAHGEGGRTLGINSEMDALPGIGHACGHNLIAIAGVAVALAVKDVLEKLDIPGKIALLGTPGTWLFVVYYVLPMWSSSGRRRCWQDHPVEQRGVRGDGCLRHVS